MHEVTFEDAMMADLVPGTNYLKGDDSNYTRSEPVHMIFKFPGLRGVGNMGGIRRAMQENPIFGSSQEEAFVVLLDTRKHENWQNVYDPMSGILTYYGDNESSSQHYLSTNNAGNKALQKFFQRAYNEPESHLAPFFYFEKQVDDSVKYVGIAIPYVPGTSEVDALSLERFTDPRTGIPFENLVGHFTVLEVTAKREWLYDLKRGITVSEHAPNEWLRFLVDRDLSSRVERPLVPGERLRRRERLLESIGYRMTIFRRTQGRFRRGLLESRRCCDLCGMAVEPLLVASHILPWSVADEHQRQDLDNGLLLCVTHDALFDKGFITFEDDGRILISEMFPRQEWPRLSIDETMHLSHIPRNKAYMRLHRANIFKTSSR
ncbi:HNH endonuclease [Exiguobacterium profundum]|uniref:HNH endonuclease n=1 Tax=Exiguobacterium profundum TaxID=307643 RepID=UPI0009394FB1|nr:HNH endonuclease [Exiguobacterium profundum]